VGSRAAESPIDDPVSLFDGRGSHDSVVSSLAISAELAVGRQGQLFDGISGSFGSGSLFGSEGSGSFLFDSTGSGVGSLSVSFSLSGSGSLSGEHNSFLIGSFGLELIEDGMSLG